MQSIRLLVISFFICAIQARAQREDTFIVRTNFANQGEQEDYLAEKFFYEKYKRENHKRFAQRICVIDQNHIKFGNKVLQGYFSPEHILIFTQCIFYPQIIVGNSISPKISKEEISKMTDVQKVFYKMNQNDTLFIGEFEELKFLSKSPSVKRFRFWQYFNWTSSPQVYFFELTNNKADKDTELQTFIKGARLTFIKEGWSVI